MLAKEVAYVAYRGPRLSVAMLSESTRRHFLQFCSDEIDAGTFEAWVCADGELEGQIGHQAHLDLIAADYRGREAAAARDRCAALLVRSFSMVCASGIPTTSNRPIRRHRSLAEWTRQRRGGSRTLNGSIVEQTEAIVRTGRELAQEIQAVLIGGTAALPATADDFASTERRLGISIPADVRAFYGVMNGTNDLTDLDHGLVRFWSLEEWKLAGEEVGAALDVDLHQAVVVADHLHWSWGYAADFTKAPAALPFFIVGGSGGLVPIAPTFTDFVELVLRGDPRIYGS